MGSNKMEKCGAERSESLKGLMLKGRCGADQAQHASGASGKERILRYWTVSEEDNLIMNLGTTSLQSN